MSSLWTPGGERPVNDSQSASNEPTVEPEGELTEEQMTQRMADLQAELAGTPAAMVVANHCFGLFELAALHLSLPQPQLAEARVAIDALSAITNGLQGRLGEGEAQLIEGLNQLQLAFVQISNAAKAAAGNDVTESE